jgi:hypothetical protein
MAAAVALVMTAALVAVELEDIMVKVVMEPHRFRVTDPLQQDLMVLGQVPAVVVEHILLQVQETPAAAMEELDKITLPEVAAAARV